MMDNIDKDEIRRAIDRLQIEHHAHFTFDVTLFDNGTDFSVIQRAIDVVAKKCADDAEINIICEMAKLYLDGVKPVLKEPDRPHGEWIFHRYDHDFECSNCHVRFDENEFSIEIPDRGNVWHKVHRYKYCPLCGSDNQKDNWAKEGEAE